MSDLARAIYLEVRRSPVGSYDCRRAQRRLHRIVRARLRPDLGGARDGGRRFRKDGGAGPVTHGGDTGTTAKQVTDWCNQGLIMGQREPLGKGRKREFSFFNIMEVAGAVALMEVGIRSPADAFKASSYFSHIGGGGSGWVKEDGTIEDDKTPSRWPSFPFHFREGETFLAVSGEMSEVILSEDGTINTYSIFPAMRRPAGLIVLNMSEVFARVMHSMARDYREVLDEAYSEEISV